MLLNQTGDVLFGQSVPWQVRQAVLHLSVHTDGIGGAGIKINGVDVEIPLSQTADELLAPDAESLPLQALPQHVVDVLDAEKGRARFAAGPLRDYLHHVPAV